MAAYPGWDIDTGETSVGCGCSKAAVGCSGACKRGASCGCSARVGAVEEEPSKSKFLLFMGILGVVAIGTVVLYTAKPELARM